MHSSVSSQPSGRLSPSRPMPVAKPPAASKALPAERGVAAQHVAHPHRPRRQTPVGAAHHPVELLGEPRRPAARRPDRLGAAADRHHRAGPRTPRRSAAASRARPRRRRRGRRRSRRAAAAIPVLRPADSPRGPALASTRTMAPGRAPVVYVLGRAAGRSSAGLWSTTSSISRAGCDWAPHRGHRGEDVLPAVLGVDADHDGDAADRLKTPLPGTGSSIGDCGARRRSARRSGAALAQDHPQHPQPVPHRPQIADAVDAVVLVAGDLLHPQPGLDHPDVHQRLDLEPGAVQVDLVQAVPPEGVVAVAQVGVAGAELGVDDGAQHPVAELADRRSCRPCRRRWRSGSPWRSRRRRPAPRHSGRSRRRRPSRPRRPSR